MIETERLTLRELSAADAPFMLELLNEPGFLANIGDRGIRTLEGAQGYVDGQVESYRKHRFGLWRVGLKADDTPVGISGLVKRDIFEDPDIGYAMLARFSGQGMAQEAGRAVLNYGRDVLGIRRIVAITAPDNDASGRVLEKLGLRFEGMVPLEGYEDQRKYFISDR